MLILKLFKNILEKQEIQLIIKKMKKFNLEFKMEIQKKSIYFQINN